MSERRAKRWAGVAVCAIAGCSSTPLSRSYVLRAASETEGAQPVREDLPLLRIENVQVPDYLDGHDLLLRQGENGLVSSPTGHWRERLSAGITDALAADLGSRLTREWVSTGRTDVGAARRLRVTIERFDVWPDGHCVLIASWSITPTPVSIAKAISTSVSSARLNRSVDAPATPAQAPAPPAMGRGRFEQAAGGAGPASDAAVVAAMGAAVDALAARIALTAGDDGPESR